MHCVQERQQAYILYILQITTQQRCSQVSERRVEEFVQFLTQQVCNANCAKFANVFA